METTLCTYCESLLVNILDLGLVPGLDLVLLIEFELTLPACAPDCVFCKFCDSNFLSNFDITISA